MSYPINGAIPAANNDPADDQPEMQTNYANIKSYLSVDHKTPGTADDGFHTAVHLLNGGTPATLSSAAGTFYTNTANSENQLHYIPSTDNTKVYQLTTTDAGDYSLFGTNTAYATNHLGGWTFLAGGSAGGLVMAYGVRAQTSTQDVTISFPITFSSVYCLNVSQGKVSGTVDDSGFYYRNVTNSGFDIRKDDGNIHSYQYSFTAIGIL